MGGKVSCTLGEVKNRADLIIYWGGNPAECHPRHFTKYTLTQKGKFVPNGRKDRTMVLVDIRETPSAKAADLFLQVRPARDFEVITTLRALITARHGRTLILTKKDRAESNTNYAQGGIAGALAEGDDVRLHAADTITAGAGLCREEAVETLVTEGPDRIRDLMAMGAQFSHEAETGEVLAWEEIDIGRYMPRRIKGSCKGRALG